MSHEPIYPATWRFTPVIGKASYLPGWHSIPFKAEEITTAGIGLILGPLSGGTMAIDFDGPEGVEWYKANAPRIDLPDTVIWTSGRESRMQMAFRVPQAFWDDVRTLRTAPYLEGTTQKHGIEFRWAGTKSVLPPSPHPETGQRYSWIVSPCEQEVAELPAALLEWWIIQSYRPPSTPTNFDIRLDDEALAKALSIIQSGIPHPGYKDWARIAHALFCCVGLGNAKATMMLLWPEQQAGEYDRLFRSINTNASPKMGTLVHMARQFDPDFLISSEGKLRRRMTTLMQKGQSAANELPDPMNVFERLKAEFGGQ